MDGFDSYKLGEPKAFRITIYFQSAEGLTGPWRKYDMEAIAHDCRAFALNGVDFAIEFSDKIEVESV